MGFGCVIRGALVWSVVALAVCGYFRMVQLSILRSRSRRLRELGGINTKRWKYARLVRSMTGYYLLAAHIGYFLGAGVFGVTLAFVASDCFSALGAVDFSPFASISFAVFGVVLCAVIPLLLVQFMRAVAFTHPESTLLALAPSMVFFASLLRPILYVLDEVVGRTVRLMGLTAPCERQIAGPTEEILEIVEMTEESGDIEEDEREMIRGVVLMSDTLVREVMTPRADIVSAPINASLAELHNLFVTEKLSRILIVGNSLDEVRGVVHAKDILQFLDPEKASHFRVDAIMRPACLVPGAKKVDEVLREFRKQAIHFAVVTDEHGGVDGIVTVEDLLEEIVGEIFDEFDSPAEEMLVKESGTSGESIVDGSMPFDEFNEHFGKQLPEGEYDTVAGFILHFLGRIPEQGEIVEGPGFRFRIEELDQNRVVSLRLLRQRRTFSVTHGGKQPDESKAAALESKALEVPKEPKIGVSGSH